MIKKIINIMKIFSIKISLRKILMILLIKLIKLLRKIIMSNSIIMNIKITLSKHIL